MATAVCDILVSQTEGRYAISYYVEVVVVSDEVKSAGLETGQL